MRRAGRFSAFAVTVTIAAGGLGMVACSAAVPTDAADASAVTVPTDAADPNAAGGAADTGEVSAAAGQYPRDVPGAAPNFQTARRPDAPFFEVVRTPSFMQSFVDWAKNLRPNQGGRLWIALLVTLLVGFDLERPTSRRNRDLVLLLLPGFFLVDLVTLGSGLDDPGRGAMFGLLYAGLFAATLALFALALRRAFQEGRREWAPNLSKRVLVLLAVALFACNAYMALSQNPDDAGIYTNIGAGRFLETGKLPYGDPTLRGGAAATYGPVLYWAHIPAQLVLAPVVWMVDDTPLLRRIVVGAPEYVGPPQLATKLTVLMFHLLGVAGLVLIGNRLSGANVGWGLACLYMGSAYVNGLGGEDFTINGLTYISHISPMAITTIAFLALSRPAVAGGVLAAGAGAIYYPGFYFPLWAGYLYWRNEDWRRFVAGFGIVCLVIGALVFLLTDAAPGQSRLSTIYESTVAHQESADAYGASTFSFWSTQPALAAVWQMQLVPGWDLARPSVLSFFTFLAATFFLARGRSPSQLALLTASVAIAVQLWKSHAGGSYVEWYYSFLLIGLFAHRPQADGDDRPHRDAAARDVQA